jgi:hypothetical protein
VFCKSQFLQTVELFTSFICFSDDNWQNPVTKTTVFWLFWLHYQMNWILPNCNQNTSEQNAWERRFIFCFKKFLPLWTTAVLEKLTISVQISFKKTSNYHDCFLKRQKNNTALHRISWNGEDIWKFKTLLCLKFLSKLRKLPVPPFLDTLFCIFRQYHLPLRKYTFVAVIIIAFKRS